MTNNDPEIMYLCPICFVGFIDGKQFRKHCKDDGVWDCTCGKEEGEAGQAIKYIRADISHKNERERISGILQQMIEDRKTSAATPDIDCISHGRDICLLQAVFDFINKDEENDRVEQ